MKQILAILAILLFSINFVFSQANYTQTIRGTVIDKDSKELLVGANVVILKSNPVIGAATDADGKFKLSNVPIGRYDIRVTFLGYKDVMIPNIEVTSGKEVILNIEMQETVVENQEVEIKADKDKSKPNNEMALVSARMFTVDETSRYAASWGDVAKMASNFAGVSTTSDQRNDIIIRGNSPTGLLWRLDGIDIPSPNHFANQGTTGGPVSILNNNVLANSDFFTGAWPAEYGNATAGVFDLKMRSGNNEKDEFTGQIGFNGFEGLAEGPISKADGSSFLVDYRYSTLQVFQALGISFGVAGLPQYQDATFKLNFPGKKSSFELFGIGGIDNIAILNSKRQAGQWSYGQYNNNIYFGTGMGAVSGTFTEMLGTKAYWRTSVALTADYHKAHIDSLGPDNTPYDYYDNYSLFSKDVITSTFNEKFNSHNTFKAGITFNRLGYNSTEKVFETGQNLWYNFANAKGNTYSSEAFAELKHYFTDHLSALVGITEEHYFLDNANSVEPRTGLKWEFSNIESLSLGYGLHGQVADIDEYLYQTRRSDGSYYQSNINLGYYKSQQFVAGYDRSLSEDMHLKVEAYYQYLFDVPVQRFPSSFSLVNAGSDFYFPLDSDLVNKGTAKNYGIELTFEKFFSKGYYFLLTTSVFDSKYKGSDGIERNTFSNGLYTVNLLYGKEFKVSPHSLIAVDGKFTAAGGRWYTPIDTARSILEGKAIYNDAEAYTKQFPDYFRLDLKISFRLNGKKVTQEWALDMDNITGRKNVLTQTYDPGSRQVVTEYQLGFFPVGFYKIQF